MVKCYRQRIKNRFVFFMKNNCIDKMLSFIKDRNTYFIVNKIEEIVFVNFLAGDSEIWKGVYTLQAVVKDIEAGQSYFQNVWAQSLLWAVTTVVFKTKRLLSYELN